MTAVAVAPIITEAGIYDGLPEDAYHRDPVPAGSLSFSGAKKLLPPSCPARFFYDRAHPPAPSQAMELGTAAHKLILGTGPRLAVVDAENWRTKAAREEADEVRAGGGVPLLPAEYAQVQAMAAAIRAHPVASALFDPDRGGHAEQSLFWPDEAFGIWRRLRMDWMPDLDGPRPVLADYKTTGKTADPRAIARAMTDYRYFMQHPWYADGIRAVTGLDLPFVFCFQETAPPYLISVVQLDGEAVRAGRMWNAAACERYRDCAESGIWPGYSEEVQRIVLPAWVARGDFE